MRRPAEFPIHLGGPPIIPAAERPSESAMPPSTPRPPAPIRVDAEQLAAVLRPILLALERTAAAAEKLAEAALEANRASLLRHRAGSSRPR
jgi:hypothetical protein